MSEAAQTSETTASQASVTSDAASTTTSSILSTVSESTTAAVSETTTKQCEEMQAVDEATSKQITTTSSGVTLDDKLEFQPTSSQGVSFPDSDKTPTITVNFQKPADVQSITIPRDKITDANVEHFEVTFYSPNGTKINEQPISSSSSPTGDKNTPARLDFSQIPTNAPVGRIDITVDKTTDGGSPKHVVLDIKACTEATIGKYFLEGFLRIHIENMFNILPNILETTTIGSVPTETTTTGVTSMSEAPQTSETTASLVTSEVDSTTTSSILSTVSESTTAAVSETTTKQCEEMQAVDEATSKQITTTSSGVTQDDKLEFQPTSSIGVSFPDNDKTPTITVNFGKPADVQSITIPRDKITDANVEHFEVTFYSPNGTKINEQPISSSSSPTGDKNTPARLDSSQTPSNTPVGRIDITVDKTIDGGSPKGVVLDIKACTEATIGKYFHEGLLLIHIENGFNILPNILETTTIGSVPTETTTIGVTSMSEAPQTSETTASLVTSEVDSTTTSSILSTVSESTTAAVSETTTKQCEEMQAVDEATSKQITTTSSGVTQDDKLEFQPTSTVGVSFPDNDKTPTITVNFGKPAEVQSITIPRDKITDANVEHFEVTFYSPNGTKINEQPISSSSSPTDDKNTPARLDSSQTPSNTPVGRVDITVDKTIDGGSPKGVVLDIKACTEATIGKYTRI